MRTIYKYKLDHQGKVVLPYIHKILKWGAVENEIFLWVEVDSEMESTVVKEFNVVGTGWEIEGCHQYVDTVFGEGFVWHIYEVLE